MTRRSLFQLLLGGLAAPSIRGVIPMSSGGTFRVTQPTLFQVGEPGPEHIAFAGFEERMAAIGAAYDASGRSAKALSESIMRAVRADSETKRLS